MVALLGDSEERYTDTEPGVGTVTTALGETEVTAHTTVLEGLHNGPDFTLDSARGDGTEQSGASADVDNVTHAGFRDVSLEYATDYDGDTPDIRNVQADSFHATIQPFAIECWVRMPTTVRSPNWVCSPIAPKR